jgi:hypothetical protein
LLTIPLPLKEEFRTGWMILPTTEQRTSMQIYNNYTIKSIKRRVCHVGPQHHKRETTNQATARHDRREYYN